VTPVEHGREKYQFYFSQLDVHVLVENHPGNVVVRALSRNFSERRKAFFIRHLAAEGYIPIQYQWFADCDRNGFSGLRWIVDYSWLAIPPELTRRTARYMRGFMLGAGLLWLPMLLPIFLRTH